MKNIKEAALAGIFFFLTLNCMSYQTGNFEIQMNVNGNMRSVAFNVPLNYESTKSYALIVAMHPGGSDGKAMREMMNPALHQIDAIIACPDNPDNSIAVIPIITNYCISNYNINQSKIIVTGYSMGGYSATHYAFDHSTNIAGLIDIAPAIFDYESLNYSIVKNFPIAIIVGSEDDFISETTAMKSKIESQNGKLKYILKDGVQHMDPYFSSIDFTNDWIECYNFIIQQSTTINNIDITQNLRPFIDQSTGKLYVEFNSDQPSKLLINSYNLSGKQIGGSMTEQVKPGKNPIDLNISNFKSDCFIVTFTDEKTKKRISKVVCR
jgi:predicted alpha/beta superfamily hydrolase